MRILNIGRAGQQQACIGTDGSASPHRYCSGRQGAGSVVALVACR